MKLFPKSASILALATLVFVAAPARAVEIAAVAPENRVLSNSNAFVGQSFTVVGAGSFTNIGFNFFTNVTTPTPYAVGTGFLLSSPFVGSPSALNNLIPGFLGQANASGGFYNFGPSLSLVAGTQYYLYENAPIPARSLILNDDGYSGSFYIATAVGNTFQNTGTTLDAAFRVTGDAVSTPDGGSTALMLALGMIGMLCGRRSLRRQ